MSSSTPTCLALPANGMTYWRSTMSDAAQPHGPTPTNETSRNEIGGMRRVPDSGVEPWSTRLVAPHPKHVSMAAGALVAITASRRHAYMIAYTLDDARLLNNSETGSVVDSELRDRFALELDGDVSEFINPNEFGGYDVDFARLAEIAHEFYAPALKDAYLKGHDAGFAAANAGDPWSDEEQVYQALPEWERELLESERRQLGDTVLSDLVALIEQELEFAHNGEGYEAKAVAEEIVKDRVAPVLAERDRLGHLAKDLAGMVDRLREQVKLLSDASQRPVLKVGQPATEASAQTEPQPWTEFKAGEHATATDLDGRTVSGVIKGFFAWDNNIGRNTRANMLLDDDTPAVVHAPSLRMVEERPAADQPGGAP